MSVLTFPKMYAGTKKVSYKRIVVNGGAFSDENFAEADFSYADIRNFTFENCNLKGANFRGAKLIGTQFRNCNLTDASFINANLENAEFDAKCVFYRTDLTKAVTVGLKLPCKVGNVIDNTENIAKEIDIQRPIPRWL